MLQIYYMFTFLRVVLASIKSENSTTPDPTVLVKTIEVTSAPKTPRKELPILQKPKYSFVTSTLTNHHFIEETPTSNVVLDCRINKEQGRPNITWIKDGEPLNEKIFRFFYVTDIHKTYSLEFEQILPTESGVYECKVGNTGENKITKTFHVIVRDSPEEQKLTVKSLTPLQPALTVDDDVEFTCVGRGENSKAKSFRWDLLTPLTKNTPIDNAMVVWQDRDDQKYKVQTLKTELCSSGQSKLLLPKVSTSLHDSIITCVVFNSARYDRNTTRISVKGKAPIIEEGSPVATIVIVVIIIVFILIVSVVLFVIRKKKRKLKRKRTHSYHYASQSD